MGCSRKDLPPGLSRREVKRPGSHQIADQKEIVAMIEPFIVDLNEPRELSRLIELKLEDFPKS